MTAYLRGLDAATVLTPYARQIAGAGFSHAGRYLKSLTVGEIKALHDAGIGVWLIYETTATRALGGAQAGREDAVRASAQAGILGAPAGATIFAAVDTDVSPGQIRAVADYLTEFDRGLTLGRAGAYGCGNALISVPKGAIIPWLAGAAGWQGSRAYDAAGEWALKQGPQINAGRTGRWADLDWPALPFPYDPDLIARPDFGAWLPAGAAAPAAATPAAAVEPQRSAIPPADALQQLLKAAGCDPGPLDGIWGQRSAAALSAYYARR